MQACVIARPASASASQDTKALLAIKPLALTIVQDMDCAKVTCSSPHPGGVDISKLGTLVNISVAVATQVTVAPIAH